MSVHWFQNRRRTSVSTIGPDVAPHVTSRPRLPSAPSDCAQVAAPTLSTTTSTPRFPVRRADLARDVHGAVVERLVGAERGGPGELLVAARRDPHPRAAQLRDLQRRQRHAAADPLDQHLLTGLHPRARHEHAPRGDRRERERGGRVVRTIRAGMRRTFHAGTTTYSANVPGTMFAEEAELHAERLLAGRGSTRTRGTRCRD